MRALLQVVATGTRAGAGETGGGGLTLDDCLGLFHEPEELTDIVSMVTQSQMAADAGLGSDPMMLLRVLREYRQPDARKRKQQRERKKRGLVERRLRQLDRMALNLGKRLVQAGAHAFCGGPRP